MNPYAIALDWRHRTGDRKRAEMSPLQLYNTRTREKETFVPAAPSGQVGLFVCGPTVYDLPHLGHAKTYTQFDFLVRLLRACGFAVTYAYWVHAGLLTTSDTKMSKSLGNFVTIRDALATASARAIRFAFFSSHYRSPMRLTDDTFSRAARALDRLDRFVEGHDPDAGAGDPRRLNDARTAIDAALDDDLDTPRAHAVLFDLVREHNRDGTRGQHARALVRDFLATFALDADAGVGLLDIDIDRLIEEREQHRRNGRYAEADRIRDQLAAHGVILEDSPAGVRWRWSTR